MFENIKADWGRYLSLTSRVHESTFLRKFHLFYYEFGFQTTVVHRLGAWARTELSSFGFIPLRYLFLVVYEVLHAMVQTLYGIDIHRHATIGKGLYIGHFGGIKIGRCTMGPGCSVHQQVKLDDDTTVGARVWMGSHAVINHGAVVEDDTTLAPGAVIPACGIVKKHTLVMGAPARVIKRNYDNRALIGRPLAHAGGTK